MQIRTKFKLSPFPRLLCKSGWNLSGLIHNLMNPLRQMLMRTSKSWGVRTWALDLDLYGGLLLMKYVTLGILLSLPELQFFICKIGIIIGFLFGLNESIYIQCLKQDLAQGQCSVMIHIIIILGSGHISHAKHFLDQYHSLLLLSFSYLNYFFPLESVFLFISFYCSLLWYQLPQASLMINSYGLY